MASVRVTCPHCQRASAVDPARLPDQPVAFRCPGCQGKIVVEKAKLLGGTAPAPAAAATAPPPGTAAVPTPASPPAAPDIVAELAVPPGESLPPGLLLADDPILGGRLRDILARHGADLESAGSVDELRRRALPDPPPLIVIAMRKLAGGPEGPLAAISGLAPRERRRTFVAVVAEDVRTLDGNRAFLFGVDALVAAADLERAPAALHVALADRRRTVGPLLAALGDAG